MMIIIIDVHDERREDYIFCMHAFGPSPYRSIFMCSDDLFPKRKTILFEFDWNILLEIENLSFDEIG